MPGRQLLWFAVAILGVAAGAVPIKVSHGQADRMPPIHVNVVAKGGSKRRNGCAVLSGIGIGTASRVGAVLILESTKPLNRACGCNAGDGSASGQ